jgi:hypothetical protein
MRLRGPWLHVSGALREYNYWRGVSMTIGGPQALAGWLQEAPVSPAVAGNAPVIDLAGPPPAEELLQAALEEASNLGLRLTLHGTELLAIPPRPGLEPLREEHLRNVFWKKAERQFFPALAFDLIRSSQEAGVPCKFSFLK